MECLARCTTRRLDTIGFQTKFTKSSPKKVLINRCAKFICYDMTDSLAEDWMDRIAESPKLMLEIIKNLRDVHENKLHEIRRMEAGIEQWVHGGRINAVAFEVGE